MLEARSLRKAFVPPSLLSDPSPGNLQSTRLALHVNEAGSSCSVYIASGCRVYKIEISMEDSTIIHGKESLLIPVHAQVISSSIVDRCPHRSEIQSVVIAEGDNVDRLSYSVLPQDCGVGEGSWAGVCFSPVHWSTVAVARSFCKSIDVYDQDIHLRSLHTLWYPASLSFLQNSLIGDGNSSILAVAEGSQLTIWDLRTNHNGGCVKRVCGSIGDLIYAVSCAPSGAIAVGGSDRTVTIFDPRRWSAISRWVNCSKYEITGLSFSSIDTACIYIQGVDYEVMCGLWQENSKVFSFRGDSNWLGFNKSAKADVLAGWCDSGSIFVADVLGEQQESI
uniref:Uncharacterized protein LOC105049447 isoform X4 n=1 Tax=Elaeis guineensis var. tenera TaxID=51953 RepID=A0A8N4IA07_ELAGV|nr:uncharacterized protein LOC105049447 isoform X4 [Elaeis guineensis]